MRSCIGGLGRWSLDFRPPPPPHLGIHLDADPPRQRQPRPAPLIVGHRIVDSAGLLIVARLAQRLPVMRRLPEQEREIPAMRNDVIHHPGALHEPTPRALSTHRMLAQITFSRLAPPLTITTLGRVAAPVVNLLSHFLSVSITKARAITHQYGTTALTTGRRSSFRHHNHHKRKRPDHQTGASNAEQGEKHQRTSQRKKPEVLSSGFYWTHQWRC